MVLAEKIFRLFSLMTLSIGFVFSLASADFSTESANNPPSAKTYQAFAEDIQLMQEINHLNSTSPQQLQNPHQSNQHKKIQSITLTK